MSESKLALIDRVRERSFIDSVGFMAFAIVGALAIILAKWLLVPGILVAMGAGAAIIIYAVLVSFAGTGRIRSDQAGDNCYYLGLIFTLVSLAYAIFTFDPAQTATTIVQGFGVALASTIIGLVVRVFLSQTRADLVETENTARLELSSAAGQLAAELNQVVRSMADFSVRTQQVLEETRSAAAANIKNTAEAATEAIQRVGAQASTAIDTQSSEAMTRTKRLTNATDRVVASLEQHSETLDGLASSNAAIAKSLTSISKLAEGSNAAMATLVGQSAEMAGLQSSLRAVAEQLQRATGGLTTAIDQFAAATAQSDLTIQARLDRIEQAPKKTVTDAAAAISAAAKLMVDESAAMADTVRRLTEGMNTQFEQGLAVSARHNAALEEELARSRANVGKVHAALVEMTGELVKQVERAPEP